MKGLIAHGLGVTDITLKLGVSTNGIYIQWGRLSKIDNNYLGLYEKNPKKFIKYFSKQNEAERKKILKELLEYDILNEKVIKWLDKNYLNLVREVGLE